MSLAIPVVHAFALDERAVEQHCHHEAVLEGVGLAAGEVPEVLWNDDSAIAVCEPS